MQKKIIRVDWQDFMKNQRVRNVDLILTDPPYAISKKTGFKQVGNKGVERLAVSMDFGSWDHAEIDLDKFTKECFRVLRTGGTAIIWYDFWKLSYLADALTNAGFVMIRCIFWEKTNPVPLNQSATYLSNSRETALCAVKGGKPTFNSKYDEGTYTMPIPRHGGNKIHPTQKPLRLFEKLVLKHSNKGDFIIDPFAGSGTTGVAALKNGRSFFGCDIDADYVRSSNKRLTDLKI